VKDPLGSSDGHLACASLLGKQRRRESGGSAVADDFVPD
jgi:hypothetical protein